MNGIDLSQIPDDAQEFTDLYLRVFMASEDDRPPRGELELVKPETEVPQTELLALPWICNIFISMEAAPKRHVQMRARSLLDVYSQYPHFERATIEIARLLQLWDMLDEIEPMLKSERHHMELTGEEGWRSVTALQNLYDYCVNEGLFQQQTRLRFG